MPRIGDRAPSFEAQTTAEVVKRPLFQVRSSLRELSNAGFLKVENDYFILTQKAEEALTKA